MKKENIVTVGLIAGRHPLPVSEFIFNGEIANVLDFPAIAAVIRDFLTDRVGIVTCTDQAINSADYTDIACYTGAKSLVVYVTGLTAVTAELIKQCALNGVSLTLMHFNAADGEYYPQHIF